MRQKTALGLLVLGLCGAFGWALADGDVPGAVRYSFHLTEYDIGLARDLAEKDMTEVSPLSDPKTVFIKVELLPDHPEDSIQRLVMVQHYRYASDETIFTMIDLQKEEVVQREYVTRFPTALTSEETQRAVQLARTDERLQFYLAKPTEFDARPIQFADVRETLFGRRVVHVLMRQEGNYLVNPRVLVDLTTETVHVSTNPQIASE